MTDQNQTQQQVPPPPPPQPVTPNSPTNQPQKSGKGCMIGGIVGVIILCVILGLLALAGVGYYVWKNIDNNDDYLSDYNWNLNYNYNTNSLLDTNENINTITDYNSNTNYSTNYSSVYSTYETISDTTDEYSITAYYPVFSGLIDASEQNKINSEAKQYVEDYITYFKDSINSNTYEDAGYASSLYIDYQVMRSDDDLISISYLIDEYYSDSAHGYYSPEGFTYSLNNGYEIFLYDLFDYDYDYTSVIAEYTKNELQQKLGGGYYDMIETGTAAEYENFDNFYINDDSLTIIFRPYEVADYASGYQEVTMSFDYFGDYMNANIIP